LDNQCSYEIEANIIRIIHVESIANQSFEPFATKVVGKLGQLQSLLPLHIPDHILLGSRTEQIGPTLLAALYVLSGV
jgi:acetate kinase